MHKRKMKSHYFYYNKHEDEYIQEKKKDRITLLKYSIHGWDLYIWKHTTLWLKWLLTNERSPGDDACFDSHPNPNPVAPKVLNHHWSFIHNNGIHQRILLLDNPLCFFAILTHQLRPWALSLTIAKTNPY